MKQWMRRAATIFLLATLFGGGAVSAQASPTDSVYPSITLAPNILLSDGKTNSTVYVQLTNGENNPILAPSDIEIELVSSNSAIASVPKRIRIPYGRSYAVSQITTTINPGEVTITAISPSGHSSEAELRTVTPVNSTPPLRLSLHATPRSMFSGAWPPGKLSVSIIDIEGQLVPASETIEVLLSSSDPKIIRVSRGVTIPKGSHFGVVNIEALNNGTAVLTATRSGFVSEFLDVAVTESVNSPHRLVVDFITPAARADTGTYGGVIISATDADGLPVPFPCTTVHLSSSRPDSAAVPDIAEAVCAPNTNYITSDIKILGRPGLSSITAVANDLQPAANSLDVQGQLPAKLVAYQAPQRLFGVEEAPGFAVVQVLDSNGVPIARHSDIEVNFVSGSQTDTVIATIPDRKSYIAIPFARIPLASEAELWSTGLDLQSTNLSVDSYKPPLVAIIPEYNEPLLPGSEQDLRVHLESEGQPVPGVYIEWDISNGDIIPTFTDLVTDNNGDANVKFIAKQAGDGRISVLATKSGYQIAESTITLPIVNVANQSGMDINLFGVPVWYLFLAMPVILGGYLAYIGGVRLKGYRSRKSGRTSNPKRKTGQDAEQRPQPRISVVSSEDPVLTYTRESLTPLLGDDVESKLILRNSSQTELTNVLVKMDIPQGLVVKRSSSNTGFYDIERNVWVVDWLAANHSAELSQVFETPKALGTLILKARAEIPAGQDVSNSPYECELSLEPQGARVRISCDAKCDYDSGELLIIGTFKVDNFGPSKINDLAIECRFPIESEYVSSTGDGEFAQRTNQWCLKSLEFSESASHSIVCRIPFGASGPHLTVRGRVITDIGIVLQGSIVAAESVLVLPNADLSATIGIDCEEPHEGGELSYTIRVRNDGPDVATNVRCFTSLPQGFRFLSAAPNVGYDSNTGVWLVDKLQPGEQSQLQINGIIRRGEVGQPLNFEVSVSASQTDPDISNNTAEIAILVGDNLPVQLSFIPDSNSISSTKPCSLTVTATNSSASELTGVIAKLQGPQGLSISSNSDPSRQFASGIWRIGDLRPGQAKSIVILAEMGGDHTGPDITIEGTLIRDSLDGAAVLGRGHSRLIIRYSNLKLTTDQRYITANEGEEVTLAAAITNQGSQKSENIVLSCPIPEGLEYVRHKGQGKYNRPSGTWEFGPLNEDDSYPLEITVRVPKGGGGKVIAASWELNCVSGKREALDYEVHVKRSVVTIHVDVNSTSITDGEDLLYSVIVRNQGPDNATGIRSLSEIPSVLKLISHNCGSEYDMNTNVWHISDLAAGDQREIELRFRAQVSEAVTDAVIRSSLISVDQYCQGADIGCDEISLHVAACDVEVTATVDNLEPCVGEEIILDCRLTNLGPDDADQVVCRILIPSETHYSWDDSEGHYFFGDSTWHIDKLQSGTSQRLRIGMVITETAEGEILTAGANLLRVRQLDLDASNNQYRAQFIVRSAQLKGSISHDEQLIELDEPFHIEFLVENQGPDDATNVEGKIALPDGMEFDRSRIDDGFLSVDGLWSIGFLPCGETARLDLPVIASRAIAMESTNAKMKLSCAESSGRNSQFIASNALKLSSADLRLQVEHGPGDVSDGGEIEILVTISNLGPSTAKNVCLGLSLPDSVVVHGEVDGFAASNSVGSMMLGELAAGSNLIKKIVLRSRSVTALGNVNVAADVSSDTPDLDLTNNSDKIEVRFPEVELIPAIRCRRISANLGEQFPIDLEITNNGPDTSTNTFVEINVPKGLEVRNEEGDSEPVSDVIRLDLGSIPPETTVTRTMQAKFNDISVSDKAEMVIQTISDQANRAVVTTSVFLKVHVPVADLVLEITPVDLTEKGSKAKFSIIVKNSGPDRSQGARVEINTPNGFHHVSHDAEGVFDEETNIWYLDPMGAGHTRTLEIHGRLAEQCIGHKLQLWAALDAMEHALREGDNRCVYSFEVPSADLEVAASVRMPKLNTDGEYFLGVNVINNGPDPATLVTIRCYVHDGNGNSLINIEPSVASPEQFVLDQLAPGESDFLEFPLRIDADAVGVLLTFRAEVVASEEPDPDGSNNSSEAKFLVEGADLSLDVLAAPVFLENEESGEFVLKITNSGPNAATDALLELKISDDVSLEEVGSLDTSNAENGAWSLGTLDAGAELTKKFHLKGGRNARNSDPWTEATVSSRLFDPAPENNKIRWESRVPVVDLTLDIEMPDEVYSEGDEVDVTLYLRNDGPDEATMLQITNTSRVDLDFTKIDGDGRFDETELIWLIESLPEGETVSIRLRFAVPRDYGDPILEVGFEAHSREEQSDSSGITKIEGVSITRVDLELTLETNEIMPAVGQSSTFEFTVENYGPDIATELEVRTLIPPQLSYVSHDGAGEFDQSTGLWMIGHLEAGASEHIALQYEVSEQIRDSVVTISGEAYARQFSSELNPTDVNLEVAVAFAELRLDSHVDPHQVTRGEAIKYLYTLTNEGPDDATGIQITDWTQTGLSYKWAAPSVGSYFRDYPFMGTWEIDFLAVGETVTLELTCTVASDIETKTLSTTISVVGCDQGIPDSDENAESIDVNIISFDGPQSGLSDLIEGVEETIF